MSLIEFFPVWSLILCNVLLLYGSIYQECTCPFWFKVRLYSLSQVVIILSISSCQMVYNSNHQHTTRRYMVYRSSGGGGGGLTSVWLHKWVSSSSDRPNIYTSPRVNSLFPLVQYRSWLSGSGQMLSNEDEAILDNIISLYFSLYFAAQIYTQIWQ